MNVRQIPFDLRSAPAFGREDFFVGACNELAMHWVETWPDSWVPFPALILHGSRGSGKSHLADVWRSRAQADVWTCDALRSVPSEKIAGIKENMIIDRVDTLIGDVQMEDKLFHL